MVLVNETRIRPDFKIVFDRESFPCVLGCWQHDIWRLQLQATEEHLISLSSSGDDRVRFQSGGRAVRIQVSCHCGQRSSF